MGASINLADPIVHGSVRCTLVLCNAEDHEVSLSEDFSAHVVLVAISAHVVHVQNDMHVRYIAFVVTHTIIASRSNLVEQPLEKATSAHMIVEAAEEAGLTRAWIAAYDTFQCHISDLCLIWTRTRNDKWFLGYMLPVEEGDVGQAGCVVTHVCLAKICFSDA